MHTISSSVIVFTFRFSRVRGFDLDFPSLVPRIAGYSTEAFIRRCGAEAKRQRTPFELYADAAVRTQQESVLVENEGWLRPQQNCVLCGTRG
jgi:hypothetical protein